MRREATPDIEQLAYDIGRTPRDEALLAVMGLHAHASALVFCNLKATVDAVTLRLSEAGVSAAKLHGDLEQKDRDRVMAKLRNQSTRVLVATDVAARGIDVPSISHVINYGLPMKAEDYVHRIGRTGRAGRSGLAVTLAERRDAQMIQRIQHLAQFVHDRAGKRVGGFAGLVEHRPGNAFSVGRKFPVLQVQVHHFLSLSAGAGRWQQRPATPHPGRR